MDGAYTLTVEEVLDKAREGVDEGATQIHIVSPLCGCATWWRIRQRPQAFTWTHSLRDRLLRQDRLGPWRTCA